MLDVHGDARPAGQGENLAQGVEVRPRRFDGGVTHVEENRDLVAPRHPHHPFHLGVADAGLVFQAEGNSQRAILQGPLKERDQAGQLRGRGGTIVPHTQLYPGRAVQEGASKVHRGTLPLIDSVPGLHVTLGPRRPVHREVGSDTIRQLVPHAVAVGIVGEDVDEAGPHHAAGGVDLQPASEGLMRNGNDGFSSNADIQPGGVQTRLRVHDAPVTNHHIVALSVGRSNHGRGARGTLAALG